VWVLNDDVTYKPNYSGARTSYHAMFKVRGHGRRGRPHLRWEDCERRDLKQLGENMRERAAWKERLTA